MKPKKEKAKTPPKNKLMLNGQSWDRPAVMAIVCQRIATSSRSLSTILDEPYEDIKLPSITAVMEWLGEDEELAVQYARAKEQQADFMAEEMLDIADDARNDWMERFDKDGKSIGYVLNGDHVQRSRLRIESRKWLMGKLRPKKYGESLKVDAQVEGSLTVEITRFADKTTK